jgi:hypothetical protein
VFITRVHASELNQIEISSVVQRTVLTPADFPDVAALEAVLFGFQYPFYWRC